MDIPSKETLEELITSNLRLEDIGKIFKRNKRTINRWIKIRGLSYEEIRLKKYPSKLSFFQEQMLIGNMLGDGHIKKEGRFSFKQKKSNIEYVNHVHEKLKPFSRNIFENEDVSKQFFTITHPIFKKARKEWYDENKIKIIPKNLKLTDISIAYWFMDDGTNVVQKDYKILKLYTNCFTNEEVYRLIDIFKNDFGISSTKHKDNSIYIKAKSYFDFIDLIKKHVCVDCMKYKIDVSKAPKSLDIKHTTKEDKIRIRQLYNKGKTQREIAKLYEISQSKVCKIVNSPFNSSKLTGQASVKVNYKY